MQKMIPKSIGHCRWTAAPPLFSSLSGCQTRPGPRTAGTWSPPPPVGSTSLSCLLVPSSWDGGTSGRLRIVDVVRCRVWGRWGRWARTREAGCHGQSEWEVEGVTRTSGRLPWRARAVRTGRANYMTKGSQQPRVKTRCGRGAIKEHLSGSTSLGGQHVPSVGEDGGLPL